ncbi:MAG: HNH endonuclease [Deltaproteobacteria bacterium]|nr:HNH endonuclease [Deltaproteobacteria bacterium]
MHLLHKRAIELGSTYLSCEPQLLETLMEMAEKNLFFRLGYTGMWDFLVKELHMSESQASYFQRVAQRARAVPELKGAVLSGKISLSQARRIVGVIDHTNASRWIELAKTLKQKDLERKVAQESPRRHVREGIVPLGSDLSKLTVVLTIEEEKKLERARDLVSQGLQKPASYQQTVSATVSLFLDKKDPVVKAARAAASSRTSKTAGEVTTSANPARPPFRAQIKHGVMLRDQGQCTHTDALGVRCSQKRWVDLHHLKPLAKGGENSVDNLTTLCRAHHRFQHEMRT